MNIQQIKQEQTVFLRNQDIFSISVRGVSTTTHTEALSGAGSATILATNVKNIRSITVDASPLALGTDYTTDYGTGLTNAVVTFVANQTGDLIINYDYGSDKIYPDYPRDDLTINSYPRIAVDILNAPSDIFGIGGDQFISDVAFTIVAYASKSDDLDGYIDTIKDLYVANAKNFFYLPFVKRTLIGPTINSTERHNEIMQKNIDFLGMFNVETA